MNTNKQRARIQVLKKDASFTEIAVITYAVLTGFDDWHQLFHACNQSDPDELNKLKSINTIVSRWKNSDKIKSIVEAAQEIKVKNDIEQQRKGAEEERRRNEAKQREASGAVAGLIDYSDPKQQQRKLNELVNGATDSREALDALKTIISTQKEDRDAARERRQIQAYLPVRCKTCPLYLMHAK